MLQRLRDQDDGFTIVEAVVALTILAVVLTLMIASLGSTMNALNRAKVITVMSNLAQANVEEIRALDYFDVGFPSSSPAGVLPVGTQIQTLQGIDFEIDVAISYVGALSGLDIIDPGGAPDGDGVDGVNDFGINYKLVEVTISHPDGLVNPVVMNTLVAPPSIGANEGFANVIVDVLRYEPFADPKVTTEASHPSPQVCLTNPVTTIYSGAPSGTQVFGAITPNSSNPPDLDYTYDIRLGVFCDLQDSGPDQWHIMPSTIEADADEVHAPVTTTTESTIEVYLPATLKVDAFDDDTGLPVVSNSHLIFTNGSVVTDFPALPASWTITDVDGYPMRPGTYGLAVFADGYIPFVVNNTEVPAGYPAVNDDTRDVYLEDHPTVPLPVRVEDTSGREIAGARVVFADGLFPQQIVLTTDINGDIVTLPVPDGVTITAAVEDTNGLTLGGAIPFTPVPATSWVAVLAPVAGSELVHLNNVGAGVFEWRDAGSSDEFNVIQPNASGEGSVGLPPGDYEFQKYCDDGSIAMNGIFTVIGGGGSWGAGPSC